MRLVKFMVYSMAILLESSQGRSLLPPTRYLNPYHVLNELAPRRRFLKLININTRNIRRRTLEEPSPILIPNGKQQMYFRCSAIVFTWVALGTLFYSFYNQWPLAQSFFYAVDAGMSIGFCTDVVEPDVVSRAFTVVYILLGASCVGGALVLMVQSILEEAAQRTSLRYKQILEMDSFKKEFFNNKRDWRMNMQIMQHAAPVVRGVLSYEDFRRSLEKYGCHLSDKDFDRVCLTYDRCKNGFITYDDFKKIFKGSDKILSALQLNDRPFLSRVFCQMWQALSHPFLDVTNRIYLIFTSYICLGVFWGMKNQNWDAITATHFAVSALATGGLTAPPVDENGILPAGPAIFCGLYCIFGIPLFALTLSSFASILVERYIVEEELLSIRRPVTLSEFQFASQSLCSSDIGIHLSDFILLQQFRQGKLTLESFSFMKRHFQVLDTNRSGRLNWNEAQRVIL